MNIIQQIINGASVGVSKFVSIFEDEQLQETDLRNNVIYVRGVKYLNDNLSNIPITIQGEEEKETKETKELKTALKNPQYNKTMDDVLNKYIRLMINEIEYYLYWEGGTSSKLVQFNFYSKKELEVKYDNQGEIESAKFYEVKLSNKELKNIVVIKNEYAIIESIKYELITDRYIKKYNIKSPKNALTNNGVLSIENASPKELEKISEKVNEFKSGNSQEGNTMVVNRKAEFKNMNEEKEISFRESKREINDAIANALGIPSMLITNTTGSKYSTYEEGRKAFAIDTMLPMFNKYLSYLNIMIDKIYEIKIEADYSDTVVFVEEQVLKNTSTREDYALGICDKEEAREIIGYDNVEIDEEEKEGD